MRHLRNVLDIRFVSLVWVLKHPNDNQGQVRKEMFYLFLTYEETRQVRFCSGMRDDDHKMSFEYF